MVSFRDEKLWKLSKRVEIGERGKGRKEVGRGEKPSSRNEKREKKLAPAAGESIVPS